MREREIILSVAGEALPEARAALLTMAGWPTPARSTVTLTFWDSENDALRRGGLALDLRRKGRGFVQRLATRGGEAVEETVKAAAPDLAAVETGSRIAAALCDQTPRPVSTVRLERTSFSLSPRQGTTIEVAIERGTLTAGEEENQPVAQIALTLETGESVVLWDVALRLLEIVPCRIETRALDLRGWRLARGRDARPPSAPPPNLSLDPAMTLDVALVQAGRRLLAMLLDNEAAALDGVSEGVHQMRVAVRRLRAVLSASREMLPEEHFRWADGELAWLGSELAPARNWDVFAEGLIEPVSGALAGERGLKRLAAAVRRKRSYAYEHAREAILSPRYTAALMRLSRWFEARGWRDQAVTENSAKLMAPLGEVAADLLTRLHRKAVKRSRRFDRLAPPERHRLRIALKKLRYATEFLAPLYERDTVRRYSKCLKPLQDDLGHANDVRSAQALLADLSDGDGGPLDRAGGLVLGWHDRGLAQDEARTRRHVKRFRRSEPYW